MPDGLGGLGIAAKIAGLWPKGLGDDGGSCGPPYTESNDHEFESNPGVPPGGVIDETGYCKHCGVHHSMHGGGGAGADQGGGPPQKPDVRGRWGT